MKNYKNKAKICYVLICAGVLLVSINIPAEQLTFGDSNKIDKEIFRKIIVPDDYPTISQALTHAIDGDTIFVKPGVYKENLVINKMISLEGAAWEHVIIDGTYQGNVIKIAASGVTVKGFTITNSSKTSGAGIDINMNHYNTITMNIIQSNYYGIKLYSSNGNNISDNIISNNIYIGIASEASHANIINDNELNNNGLNGLYIHFTSTFNEAKYNIINKNGLEEDASFYKTSLAGGIVLDTACRSNSIVSNDIESNQIGVNSDGANENNILYYNSFINNTKGNAKDTSKNNWSKNGIGNFWSDYNGKDENGDGIGDIPYNISGGDNEDEYPLIDSEIPKPPIIEGPHEWHDENRMADFTFWSPDSNYAQVWYEIKWGDNNEQTIGPVDPYIENTIPYKYEIPLRYTIKARTVVRTKSGETLKSDYTPFIITWPKTKQPLEDKNENIFCCNNKPILFTEFSGRYLWFYGKNYIFPSFVHIKNLQFNHYIIKLYLVKKFHISDSVLNNHLFSKNLFFLLKK